MIHALVGDGTHGKHRAIQDLKCQACGKKFIHFGQKNMGMEESQCVFSSANSPMPRWSDINADGRRPKSNAACCGVINIAATSVKLTINTCGKGNSLSAGMLFDVSNDVDGFVYARYPLNGIYAPWSRAPPSLQDERFRTTYRRPFMIWSGY